MEVKQGTGRDTRMMIPIFSLIYMAVTELGLPWFSIPALAYEKVPSRYSLWNLEHCLGYMNQSAGTGRFQSMTMFSRQEMQGILKFGQAMKMLSVVCALLFLAGAVLGCRKKGKSVKAMRIMFAGGVVLPLAAMSGSILGNWMINQKMGRSNSFVNLTLHSYLQLTSFVYAQLFLAVLMFFSVKRFMGIENESVDTANVVRGKREDKRIGTRTMVSLLLILFAVPAVIFFGIYFLNDRSDTFISICVIILSMLPFYMVFEDRRPQAREMLLIAVMTALAVVGRMAFFMLPQFKPVTAIVIITGVGLGPEAGFLTGALTGFVSNFFFGQGPWTPWQMFAFGIIGFLAGVIFRGKNQGPGRSRAALCIYGGAATFVIYGFIMDTSSLVTFAGDFQWKTVLGIYAAGLPFNFVHGISTVVFLFFLAKPMGMKLERIKKKYGILEV